MTIACSRLSVNGDDQKSKRTPNGVWERKGEVSSPALSFSLPDPARRPHAFSTVAIDREPGTGYFDNS